LPARLSEYRAARSQDISFTDEDRAQQESEQQPK
jgi:hypothetical protein